MKRVTGIGGVFFKSKNPEQTKQWYKEHLGIPVNEWGTTFSWRDKENPDKICTTAWGPFPEDTTYFNPSKGDFMFNYMVEDLDALMKLLKDEGVEIVGKIEEYDYGKFGWILDPEGNKIELWEPVD